MRTGIVVELPEHGLDPGWIEDALRRGDAANGTAVALTSRLDARMLAVFVRNERVERLVVAGLDPGRARRWARSALEDAGGDANATVVLPSALLCATDDEEDPTGRAALILGAAAARLRLAASATEDHLRIRVAPRAARPGRRALFTPRFLQQEVLPAVDRAACFEAGACGVCRDTCPADAIGVHAGSATIDKTCCLDCGLCVSACPAGAIGSPLHDRMSLDAALRVLLADARTRPRIVLFACGDAVAGGRSLPAAVLPLLVPAIGYIDWFAVLRAFDLGAAGVAFLGCTGEGHRCDAGGASALAGAIDGLLDALGYGTGRLMVLPQTLRASGGELHAFIAAIESSVLHPAQAVAADLPPDARLTALVASLAGRPGATPPAVFEDAAFPCGDVEVDAAACSLCGLCAANCPAGALRMDAPPTTTQLFFDPQRCVACGVCAARCPEHAVTVHRRLNLAATAPVMLVRSTVAQCEVCHRPIAPQALLDRVARQAGAAPWVATMRRCPDCRLVFS